MQASDIKLGQKRRLLVAVLGDSSGRDCHQLLIRHGDEASTRFPTFPCKP